MRSLLALLILTLFISCSKAKVQYPADLSQLHDNILSYYLATPFDDQEVEVLLDRMQDDGAWASIEYSSIERGNWPVIEHLYKLQTIATAYKSKSSSFYHKKKVSEKIHLALDYWLDNDFLCPNWWYPQIGVNKALSPVLFLMEEELSEEQLEKAMVLLERSEIKMTGQNKVWLSGNVLYRSLLQRDAKSIKTAAASIEEELIVSKGEGIQYDWSYHQHGHQLQFGNYGLHYLEDMTKWLKIVYNTPFSFEKEKVGILRNYILQGMRWVDWKGQMDISACGRQLFMKEPARKSTKFKGLVKQMAVLDAQSSDNYEAVEDYSTLAGDKHFWRSDFHVNRNKDYYFSVKMCSDRVLGAESCNQENLQGYHMGDGVTFLYQSNEEYRDIFPFWDWRKLPGTTLSQDTSALQVLTAWGYHIQSDFVGGLSNGDDGIATMHYNRDGVVANKSWFMFDDKIVCLGSGITSTTNFPVVTTLNQSYLEGNVLSSKEGEKSTARGLKNINNPEWILHDGLGYLLPQGGNMKVKANYKEGNWSKVAGSYRPVVLTEEIFTLWQDHGTKPKDATYAYVLVPGADEQKMEALKAKAPFEIQNSKFLHSVENRDHTLGGAVFYQSATADIMGGIHVNKPCVVQLQKLGENIELCVADPTQKLESITITVSGKFNSYFAHVKGNKTILSIHFENGLSAGSTQKVLLTRAD